MPGTRRSYQVTGGQEAKSSAGCREPTFTSSELRRPFPEVVPALLLDWSGSQPPGMQSASNSVDRSLLRAMAAPS